MIGQNTANVALPKSSTFVLRSTERGLPVQLRHITQEGCDYERSVGEICIETEAQLELLGLYFSVPLR